MFKNPLSFKGRIRRTEYGISLIISVVYYTVLQLVIPAIFMSQYIGYGYVRKDIMADTMENIMITYCLFAIPMIYFSYAQAAKRCHDMGKSGWYALIPFYPIYLMFGEGEVGSNQYGADPKNRTTQSIAVPPVVSSTQPNPRDYNGGHNIAGNTGLGTPTSPPTVTPHPSPVGNKEFKGDLYGKNN